MKKLLGFEQFSLRGLQKVSLEWNLVCAAYNLKRLHQLLNPANQKPKTPKPPKPTPPVLVQLLSELFGLYCLAFKTNFSAQRSLRSLSRGPCAFRIDEQATV
jgi:Transposase DDE domain